MSKRYIDADAAVSNADARYGEWVLAMAAAEGTRQINMVYKKQELFKAVKKVIESCPSIDLDSLRPTWRNPDKNPPKVEEDVLILFETAYGGYGITTANYEDGTVLSQKSAFYWEDISKWGTYDKESDDYFIPKGWWEYRYFNQDDIYDNRVDAHVVGWMPLPPKEITK